MSVCAPSTRRSDSAFDDCMQQHGNGGDSQAGSAGTACSSTSSSMSELLVGSGDCSQQSWGETAAAAAFDSTRFQKQSQNEQQPGTPALAHVPRPACSQSDGSFPDGRQSRRGMRDTSLDDYPGSSLEVRCA